MIDEQISKYKAIALIYDTFHIVPLSDLISGDCFSVEFVEGLVHNKQIPREVATIIYKILLEKGKEDE